MKEGKVNIVRKMKNIWKGITIIAACSFMFVVPVYGATKNSITVMIDPGHGGPDLTDNSQVGANYQVMEKDITLLTAQALQAELSQYKNVNVYMTRNADTSVSIKGRADLAKAVNADLLVSIHYNAKGCHEYYGTEAFISAFNTNSVAYDIADAATTRLHKNFGVLNKGVKVRLSDKTGKDYYGIINRSAGYGIPAVIVEHGYIDNPSDWAAYQNQWQKAGISDATAIANYFGLSKTTTKKQITIPDKKAPVVMQDFTAPYVAITASGRTINLATIENESKPLYYAYSMDQGVTWTKLADYTGSFTVPGPGMVMVKVCNTYELEGFSNVVPVN